MIDILPEEVLATAFELGVLTIGPRFLPPVCLVCSTWNSIVCNTPRLWGIIDIYKNVSPQRIQDQLARCKAAPLTVFLAGSSDIGKKPYKALVNRLLDMSENWESAAIPSNVFEQRVWPDMYPNLEELVLTSGPRSNVAPTRPSRGNAQIPSKKLRKVVLERVHSSYMKLFLSPYLTSLTYIGQPDVVLDLAETINFLSQLPLLHFCKIRQVNFKPQLLSTVRVASLPHLETLDIAYHAYPSLLLSYISAPNLKTLTIDRVGWTARATNPRQRWWQPAPTLLDDPGRTLTPFLSQWCDAQSLPSKLHTLNLVHCIIPGDIPVLVSFLQRIPGLVRLTIVGLRPGRVLGWNRDDDDEHEDEATGKEVARIFSAPLTANDSGDHGETREQWLLPSLMILQLELRTLQTQDLTHIAQQRGIYSTSTSTQGPPKNLRTLFGFICSGGNEEEDKHLRSLVETAYCTCIGCSMGLMSVEE
ncbi:hypothetical protein BKA70DRAFT_516267 [Coprinopsis sp. MPI-PUGE-AT-0042]|nr:hypothetical protein BKA70DRAFT_516267 [Coprinopsis sp. MPI-PUGE-AT-0042]